VRTFLLRLSIPLALALSIGAMTAGAAVAVDPSCPASVAPPQGSVRVCSPGHLADILNSDFRGRIIIPRDVSWEMKGHDGQPLRDLPVKSDIELVGERGELGSRPMLFTRDISTGYSLLSVTGNDVHISGIRFRGPKLPSTHGRREATTNAIHVREDFDHQLGRRVLIEDNELEQWSGAGVVLRGMHEVKSPSEWDPSWPAPGPADAGLVRVERNYIHDNFMDGHGYGVEVQGGAYGTAEGNLFANNRHSVSASGEANVGYVARYNYILAEAIKEDGFYNQHFDVHGTGKGGYGGAAGTYFDIGFNTVRGEQGYFAVKTRPVLMLRARPARGMYFHDNVVVHDDRDEAVSLTTGGLSRVGIGENERAFNFRTGGNRFDTDYSTEIASGDFDGDGRHDVFVANGTGWWYSRAGIKPWELLHPSTKRTKELAFADIDNDGRTDVLYREGAGYLRYLKSGTAPPAPLTVLPRTVAIGDLRFGDFDGDRRTDMFYTRAGQWYVWYGSTRRWTPTQTSSAQVKELLFGDFDAVRGTDVVAVLKNGWSYSSASTQQWVRFNARLTLSFDNAVAADFDGDGRTDIAVSTGTNWRYSPGGRGRLAVMRNGNGLPSFKKLEIARFDPGPRAVAVGFAGDRLATWPGFGTGAKYSIRSPRDMR
jgi:FG-GAP-like repeat